MKKTTLKLLTEYLPKYGWPAFQVVDDTTDGGKILTGWSSPFISEPRLMFISVSHSQNTFNVVVPMLVSAPQEEMPIGQLADVLTAIGFANYALALGRFAYDPRDGEIRLEFGIPIDGAAITYGQFEHVMNVAQASVMYWAPRIKDIAEGGRTGGSVVASFLDHAAEFGD